MKKTLKLLPMLAIMALLVLSACNKEANDSSTFQKQTTHASFAVDTKKVKAKVFDINSVVKMTARGKAVDFTWTENGKEKSFADLTKGKVVFINFWGTWCPPCRRELPDIIEIANEKKDVVFIGITLERTRNAADKVKAFAEKQGIPYRLFMGNQDIVTAYGGIPSVPTTFIIDKKGNVNEKLVGMKSKGEFLSAIARAK